MKLFVVMILSVLGLVSTMRTWRWGVDSGWSRWAGRLILCLAAAFLLLGSGPARAVVIDLGAAGVYVGATVNGTSENFNIYQATVNGDIFVGNRDAMTNDLDSQKGKIATVYYNLNPEAKLNFINSTYGGPSPRDGAPIKTDLDTALAAIAGLSATQTFAEIKIPTTISSTTLLNVIDVTGNITLYQEPLTLSGNPGDYFIVRVGGNLKASAKSPINLSGLGPEKVLFVVNGSGGIQCMDSNFNGTYIATKGIIEVDYGTHNGAFLQYAATQRLDFDNNAILNYKGFQPTPTPLPASALLLGSGLMGLGLLGWRRRRS